MGLIMKVKFIARDKTREFKEGEILEAERVVSKLKSEPLIMIADKWGENYAYPASWFEMVEE